MIWLLIPVLMAAVLAPLAFVLRRTAAARGGRDPALALHRNQLVELDRDLAEGRILPAEHATAVLEVQRRLLAVADTVERPTAIGARWPVMAALVAVPIGAIALYAVGGQPYLPTLSGNSAEMAGLKRQAEEAALIQQLRERLLTLDPLTDQARQGYVLLGNVEETRGNDAAAAEAWRTALKTQFDVTLAVRAAEAATRAEGRVSEASAALFRRALAAAPADAPWRASVEGRLATARPPS